MLKIVGAALTAIILTACASPTIKPPSTGHLKSENAPKIQGTIPQIVQQGVPLPKPRTTQKTETYNVVVNNVSVQDLLFALARDAKLNVDIHPGITGTVSMNAIDQTLPQLLTRISKQVDMRFELDGPNLAVMPDAPYLKNYKIDYVNMTRDTTGTVAVTTQIATAGSSGIGSGANTGGGNNSATRIENKSLNHFWDTLIQNIKDILHETDKIFPDGSSETFAEQANSQITTGTGTPVSASNNRRSTQTPTSLATSPNPAALQSTGSTIVRRTTFREAASVIANPETGVVSVRANSRQHEKLQEFIDRVLGSARRQVLIEATIAEVQLSSNYQQGIDWNAAKFGAAGFTVTQKAVGNIAAPVSSLLQLAYTNSSKNMTAAVTLLESFGNVKVLSSPKISVLNNQTAVLKVVDNNVYFTIKADTTQNQTTTATTFTTTLNQVPVGFVMNVTPQISDTDTVLLNIRPSISRIVSYVNDPNPSLKATTANGFGQDIVSKIPVIRSREMESVIRVSNGNIAVMGGLMEDTLTNTDNAVPGISRIPLLGQLFTQRDDAVQKTELVIFLRPVVVKDASIEGDYSNYRANLPGVDFFNAIPDPQARSTAFGTGASR